MDRKDRERHLWRRIADWIDRCADGIELILQAAARAVPKVMNASAHLLFWLVVTGGAVAFWTREVRQLLGL